MENTVTRIFSFDFIYLDLAFCLVWMIILVLKNKNRSLTFGLAGAVIVFFFDDVMWFHLKGTRHIQAPINPDLFLLYFSFTYGMIEFSYVTLMFAAKNKREMAFWTILLYAGWFLSAFLSQWMPIDERIVNVSRDMSSSRITQIIMVVFGYTLLIVLRNKWEALSQIKYRKILYLFAVGFVVHFGMEISLALSGIRPYTGNLDVLAFNSLFEFNSGIPYIFIAWTYINRAKKVA